MTERHNRQSFLGANSEIVLGSSRVAVVGLGGGGSHVLQQLAHVGIGTLVVIDPDVVEPSNLNRLVGATHDDAVRRTAKSEIARRAATAVNPCVRLLPVTAKWQDEPQHLRSAHVVVGCVDGYSERQQLESFCRRFLLPYVDIGMDVHELDGRYVISGQVITSVPGDICMTCMGFLNDRTLAQEAAAYGVAGHKPQVVWPNGLLASAAVGVVVHLLTPWFDGAISPYLEYDGNSQTMLPSNRLLILKDKECGHFSSLTSVGDPFWIPELP